MIASLLSGSWRSVRLRASVMAFAMGLVMAGGCKDDKSQSNALTIAVIPKGATHEHWQRVRAGAEQAGKEFGVNIIWKAPQTETTASSRSSSSSSSPPTKSRPLSSRRWMKRAWCARSSRRPAEKIPVILIDSGLAGEAGKDYIAYVGTDNRKGGVMAGEALARRLAARGTWSCSGTWKAPPARRSARPASSTRSENSRHPHDFRQAIRRRDFRRGADQSRQHDR